MARWEPGSQGKLRQAALALYAERGFEQTTVAEIAARAGLTERTFFRHFADKREVLFWGSNHLQDLLVRAVAAAPAATAPLDAIAAALETADTTYFAGRRDSSRQRQAVIDANPELQERERSKLAALALALAEALRQRGVGDPTASLAAEAGVVIFKVAFERWIGAGDERDLAQVIREALAELRAVTAASPGRQVS